MEEKITEICSNIHEIQLTSRLLLKRLNKVIDEGDKKCTSHRESESIGTDIRKLQSHVQRLEDKVSARDENHLRNDVKMLTGILDLIESKLQLEELSNSDTSHRGTSETNTGVKPVHGDESEIVSSDQKSLNLHKQETNTISKTRNVSENASDEGRTLKGGATRTIDIPIENNKTEDIKHTNENRVGIAEYPDNQSAGEENKLKSQSTFGITKQNFIKSEQSVKLIKQEVNIVGDGKEYWLRLAQNMLDEYYLRFMSLDGVRSIICLDISESMAHSNAWRESRTFIADYLTGLETMSKTHPTDVKKEYVALLTFGHQTKIQVGYTDDFRNIEKTLDETKLGGPTQMYGGFLMALAASYSCNSQFGRFSGYTKVDNKIIVISDGRPTEEDLIAGPDIADSRKIDETKANLFQKMEYCKRNIKCDLFVVPVGDSDLEFLRTMAECSDGMVIDYRQGKRVAKRQYLTRLLNHSGLAAGLITRDSDRDLSHEDIEDLKSLEKSLKCHSRGNTSIAYNPHRYSHHTTRGLADLGAGGHHKNYKYGQQEYALLLVDDFNTWATDGGYKKAHERCCKCAECYGGIGVDIGGTMRMKSKKNTKSVNIRDNYLLRDSSKRPVQNVKDTRKVVFLNDDTTDTRQYFELQPPQALTIEEFAAQQTRKNKNSK